MTKDASDQVEKFFLQYRLRKYLKGQVLILNGDDIDYVYYMESGRVKQYDVTYRGSEIIMNVFSPPAFFPMSPVINQTPNPYIYEAETDITVRRAPIKDVVNFIKNSPDVMYDLLSRVYWGLDGLLSRMGHLMASNARNRLIFELITECKRFGRGNGKGGYFLDVSEKDLGARAGLSRETVSREIHKLKGVKLIKVERHQIIVRDLEGLENIIKRDH